MPSTAINELLMQASPLGEVFVAGQPIKGVLNYQQATVYLISARQFGLLSSLKFIFPESSSATGANFVRFFRVGAGTNASTVRIKWYVIATGAEVANGVDLSADSIRVMAVGN